MNGNDVFFVNGYSRIGAPGDEGKTISDDGNRGFPHSVCANCPISVCRENSTVKRLRDKDPNIVKTKFERRSGFHWRVIAAFLYGIYTWFPLNTTSRLVGLLARIKVPKILRSPAWRTFAWIFGAKLEEAEFHADLWKYASMSDLFRRRLVPNARPVDHSACLTSPVDGRIISCGKVDEGHLEQVKGLAYTLRALLGPNTWSKNTSFDEKLSQSKLFRSKTVPSKLDDTGYAADLLGRDESRSPFPFLQSLGDRDKKDNALYHCAIYLAPGDYHCFHTPTDWTISMRRHFPGRLFSVCSLVTSWLNGVFCINERAVYMGKWVHGFFAYVAVGATNVGSIRVFTDPNLITNRRPQLPCNPFSRRVDVPLNSEGLSFDSSNPVPVIIKMDGFEDLHFPLPLEFTKGSLFGEFNFGSTVVLIFEAPIDNFEFVVKNGQRVQVGRPLGQLRK